MKDTQYDKVCYTTQQQEQHVPLRNVRTGVIGYSYLCTEAGTTIQVRLENGELDSWDKADCVPVEEGSGEGQAKPWTGWDKNDVEPKAAGKPEEDIMGCTSDRHSVHMCELKRKGEFGTITALSAIATMECGICGAVAAAPENLCDPAEFPTNRKESDTYQQKTGKA